MSAKNIILKIIEKASWDPLPDDFSSSDPVENERENKRKRNEYIYSSAKNITSQTIQTINSEAEYYFGKYAEISEDYKTGVSVRNAKAAISTFNSIASSTISTAISGGMAFGPIGAAVGAAIGLATSAVSANLSANNEYNEAVMQIQRQAYSNYFYSERAGYMDGGRGTNN